MNLKHPTVKELRLAGKLLEMASESYSNHGCNDIDDEMLSEFTEEELKQMAKEFHEWNGDPEENDGHPINEDWVIMLFLAAKLNAFEE